MKNYTFRDKRVNQTSLVIRGREVEGSASSDILKSGLWYVSWNFLKSNMDVDFISPFRTNELVSIYVCVLH